LKAAIEATKVKLLEYVATFDCAEIETEYRRPRIQEPIGEIRFTAPVICMNSSAGSKTPGMSLRDTGAIKLTKVFPDLRKQCLLPTQSRHVLPEKAIGTQMGGFD
jgi:hypothetical protein